MLKKSIFKRLEEPPIVTTEAERPAGKKGECFYCQKKMNEQHNSECVLWEKTVLIRMTVEYPVKVPHFWSRDNVEFHRNEGSWCGDNVLQELEELPDEFLCSNARFEYMSEAN